MKAKETKNLNHARHAEFSNQLKDVLFSCWNSDVKSFDAAKFFSHWFKLKGTPLFFLFKKNLSQSNIQCAELLALIRSHAKWKCHDDEIHDLQFLTFQEFVDGFSLMVSAFGGGDGEAACNAIVELYSEALSRVVLVEPFFGSATVYVPPHLVLDHRVICAESGYIHSSGPSVFVRQIDKTSKKDLIDTIETYVNKRRRGKGKVFFTVYAHEDFTQYDREQEAQLRGGLDEVKVFVEKYSINNDPLVSVLKQLQERLKGKLVIPEPGDFRRQHKIARKQAGLDKSRTIWIIIDRGISETPQVAGKERFLICYDQEMHNSNPFQLFDENKPAWVSHTTISHELAGAMINLTRPWIGHTTQNPIRICDPFGGTGTVWFEAAKFDRCQADSTDKEELTPLLVRDNLFFFSRSASELKEYAQGIRDVLKLPALSPRRRKKPRVNREAERAFKWMAKNYPDLISHHWNTGEVVNPKINALMAEQENIFYRLLVYIALRTRIRHVNQFERGAASDNTAFRKEAEILEKQLQSLIKQREREQIEGSGKVSRLNLFLGNYSVSCGISKHQLARIPDSYISKTVFVRDVFNLPKRTYDVIVTDPPYGFNTDDDQRQLAKLYAKAIRAIVRSLRDGGHLVMCLPERSNTGKKLPAFTTAGFVTQQILTEAELVGRDIVLAAQSLPKPGSLFRPPYYWESERALRRTILHFHFRSKNKLMREVFW
jgi:tRNA G10  N-methylase Trm11